MLRRSSLVWIFVVGLHVLSMVVAGPSKGNVEEVNDIKELKKILRTKKNILILFSKSSKDAQGVLKICEEVAETIYGSGSILHIDCGKAEVKKLCKKLKAEPDSILLKHFKDGEYHKDYDRQLTTSSMIQFMRDPTGDRPWEEESSAKDIKHLHNSQALTKVLEKEGKQKGVMVMFYAPWCGFCKKMKPDFAAAASELKGEAIMAAMDVTRPENSQASKLYNITAFPTLIYFEEGKRKLDYEGENRRDALVSFMRDPRPPPAKEPEPEWSETPSDVIHLSDSTFDPFIQSQTSVLVMFYAPWCGHCKRMKPQYVEAAKQLKEENISGHLAAVDATKEKELAKRFEIKGYPSVRYFQNGSLKWDVNVREKEGLVNFMKDPKEPPPPPPPEAPWKDTPSEVIHLDAENFRTTLRRKKHALVMFYAPWCGHCKAAKPEFVAAAEHFKDDPKVAFGAVDCTVESSVCSTYDVQGYPTLKYFHYFDKDSNDYSGERKVDAFVSFMLNHLGVGNGKVESSQHSSEEAVDPSSEWTDLPGSQYLTHLNQKTFDSYIQSQDVTLVMFYAPWCGFCKKMKGDYAKAAQIMAEEHGLQKIALATVDGTAETSLNQRFEIKGYPTLKLFKKGTFVSDYRGGRTAGEISAFILDAAKQEQRDEL